MKFYCKCGNMINATISPCSGLCNVYSQNEYIKFIDWIKAGLPINSALYPNYIRTYYCESCGSYYLEMENKYYILKPIKYKIGSETYTELHIMDEKEEDKLIDKIKEDKTIIPATRKAIIQRNMLKN